MVRYMEEILVVEQHKITSIWITMRAKEMRSKIKDSGLCLELEESNQLLALREDKVMPRTTSNISPALHVEHKTLKLQMVGINTVTMWSNSILKLIMALFSLKINMSKIMIKMKIHMMNSLRRKLKQDSTSSLKCKINSSYLRMIQLIKMKTNNQMDW